jgi:hypothetical protein
LHPAWIRWIADRVQLAREITAPQGESARGGKMSV